MGGIIDVPHMSEELIVRLHRLGEGGGKEIRTADRTRCQYVGPVQPVIRRHPVTANWQIDASYAIHVGGRYGRLDEGLKSGQSSWTSVR